MRVPSFHAFRSGRADSIPPSLNKLWSWGGKSIFAAGGQYGNQGLGDTINRSSPVQVGTETNWSMVSGCSHTLATKTTGTLWAWGDNNLGQLGLNNLIYLSSPIQVGTNTDWSSVSVNRFLTFAIKTTGTLWGWGNNSGGRLGLGDVINRSSPVQIGTDTNWAKVSAGLGHTLAIKTTGSLWAWGDGTTGRLGLGDIVTRSSPVQVGTGTDWASVSSGPGHTIAIKTTGSLWAWGGNGIGQLGLGDFTARSSPVQVGAGTDWSKVSVGGTGITVAFTMAVKTTGTLWAWGSNAFGQLGLRDAITRFSPVQVGTGTDWASVTSGHFHTSAIKTTGTLWAWGRNRYGALGTGLTDYTISPTQLGTGWSSISAGHNQTLAVKSNGTLWSWGTNTTSGQLGLGDVINRSSPVQVGTGTDWAKVSSGFGTVELGTSFAIKTTGTLWSWGLGTTGQLGHSVMFGPPPASKSSPVQVGTGTDWASVDNSASHTVAIKTGKSLWVWGNNFTGRLGLNTTVPSSFSSPMQLGVATDWESVSVGYLCTMAIRTGGTLWGWGQGTSGQLGLGNAIAISAPVQVGTGTNWASVSVGNNHTMAIKTTGTLWGWGANTNGRLGTGNTTACSSPVQVGAGTNWSKVSAGSVHTLAIKTDGTLWAWGNNTYHNLGLNDTMRFFHRSSPVQVGTSTDWASVTTGLNHTIAVKTDGTLFVWGDNRTGQLGIPFRTDTSSPVQIGSNTNWSKVNSGYFPSSHAISID